MKNKTKKRIGIVAMMLLLVVAIAATAGNTLAKYIYSATVTPQAATVAKWGFVVTANTTELFSEQYSDNNVVSAGADEIDVKADAKVVAPGTSNATGYMVVTISGYAEVDAELTIDVSDFKTVWLDRTVDSVVTEVEGDVEGTTTTELVALTEVTELEEDIYYPIKWTIGETELDDPTEGEDYEEVIADAIATALGEMGEGVEATADGAKVTAFVPAQTEIEATLEIKWEWEFEATGDDANHDVEDTILGALAAGDADWISTSADDGETDTKVNLGAYTEDENYGLEVGFTLKAKIVQTQSAQQTPDKY